MRCKSAVSIFMMCLVAGCATPGNDRSRLVTTEHYVQVKSTAPGHNGKDAKLYVREVMPEGMSARGPSGRPVVLFVHGAGTPAEVAFDVPHADYSWMAYLAKAGFDTFAMDLIGYGRSTRPAAMENPCNLAQDEQAHFVPVVISAPCAPTLSTVITTLDSDWHDIGAVVDHLRALRGVDHVSLIGWSLGGPRAGGYAVRNPDKVARLVVLAPVYTRASNAGAPSPLPPIDGPMRAQSAADFKSNWDRQVGCSEQYDSATSAAIWADMLASDPVGAKWGPGVRRAPRVLPTW
ncbi:MAG: alpha/beta fold hydrolase, partial [Betaproteobacteria bacterium]